MSDHSDLGFVPDTKDHADLGFTPEEVASDNDLLSMRSLKDLGIGAAQGITLGGADELAGAAQATGDVAFGDTKLQDWVQKYRQHQQEQQQAFEEAKTRSPVLTTAGELAGGLALPMGAIGATGKGMGMIGKAAISGGIGGLAGGLSSTGTIGEDPGQIGKDILTGGALGAAGSTIIEKAAPMMGKLAGKVSEVTGFDKLKSNYPSIRQSIIPFTETLEGRPFLGEAGEKLRYGQQLPEAASALDEPLNKLRGAVGDKYTQVLSGQTLNLTPELANDLNLTRKTLNAKKVNIGLEPGDIPSTEGLIPTSEQMGIQQKIDAALSSGKVSAQDLKDIQKFARDEMYNLHGGEAKDVLGSLNKQASRHLETIPGYSEVNKQFGEVEDTLSSFAKKVPIEELDITGRKVSGEKLYKTSEDVISKAQLPYDTGRKQSKQLSELGENLQLLAAKDPTLLEKIGIKDIPAFIQRAKDAADIQAVTKSMRGAGQMGQTTLMSKVGGGSKAGIQYAGALAGSVANKTSNAGAKLAAMPAQSLSGLAQRLSSNKATQHMGEALSSAIQASVDRPGSVSKNAALFTILQNPSGRKVIREMFPDMEEEGK